jgi:hypothetical protein
MTYQQKIRRLYGLDDKKDFGFSERDILDCEKRLNFKFPKTLREYYLKLGKNQKVNNSFNQLLKPKNEIDFSIDKNLVFYEENQAVVYWSIREQDLRLENPSVYRKYDITNITETWILDSPTMEDFLLTMAIWNGVLGGFKFNANTLSPDQLKESIIRQVENKWTELKGITNQELRLFSNDFSDVLAFTTDKNSKVNGLFVGTNDKVGYSCKCQTGENCPIKNGTQNKFVCHFLLT